MPENPVILCYDGSEDAKLAIKSAADLFGTRTAVVLTAWQPAYVQMAHRGFGAAYVPDLEEMDAAAAKLAANLSAEGAAIAHAAGLAAEPAEVRAVGPVWDAILRAADERDAAAIVLGSRGLSGIKSWMLGSVSGSVVHHATRPVLVVRHRVLALAPSETADEAELAGPLIG